MLKQKPLTTDWEMGDSTCTLEMKRGSMSLTGQMASSCSCLLEYIFSTSVIIYVITLKIISVLLLYKNEFWGLYFFGYFYILTTTLKM